MIFNATTRAALLAAAALLPLAACGKTEQAVTTVQSAAQAQVTPTLSTTDATFINEAGRAGAEEVTAGQLAQTKAVSPAIRRFASRMVTDHTAADQDLLGLAQTKQMTPATGPDDAHATLLTKLQGLLGRAFDRAYMQAQVMDHEAATKLYQNEIDQGTDPDVKALAARQLPLLKTHLSMARALAPR